jgi:hypothetical protein
MPTPTPTLPPTPSPSASPTPAASGTPTPAPTASATPPPAAAAAPNAASLPFTALAPSGSAQAAAIESTPQGARTAADTGAPSDASNLFLLFTLAIMAIPVLLTMTLLATVLTRR